MIVIGKKILEKYVKKHGSLKCAVQAWINDVETSEWKSPQDIKNRYSSASFLAKNRVIFNIKGNNYRLIVIVVYSMGFVNIEWIGSHSEYNKTDWN